MNLHYQYAEANNIKIEDNKAPEVMHFTRGIGNEKFIQMTVEHFLQDGVSQGFKELALHKNSNNFKPLKVESTGSSTKKINIFEPLDIPTITSLQDKIKSLRPEAPTPSMAPR